MFLGVLMIDAVSWLSVKLSARFLFTPWLQPGDPGQIQTTNRFNGFLEGWHGRSEGPSFNSHGREAVDSPRTLIVERRRCGINSLRITVGPAGLDFVFRRTSHGLTAVAIEFRACGALPTDASLLT
jgi:hypothetical protein